MKSTEKFLGFLEAIKTDKNATLIENVANGFKACCENGGISFVAPAKAVGGIASNIPHSEAPELDLEEIDAEDAELPEEPNIGDEGVAGQATADIMRLVEFLKSDPKGIAILKDILEKTD